uniref:Uncharacterized protein n=1 Tax=Panagrolaimus sp. ES5 TaxID=591445 RepID=A0AC34GWF9_9BILA
MDVVEVVAEEDLVVDGIVDVVVVAAVVVDDDGVGIVDHEVTEKLLPLLNFQLKLDIHQKFEKQQNDFVFQLLIQELRDVVETDVVKKHIQMYRIDADVVVVLAVAELVVVELGLDAVVEQQLCH